MHGLGLPERLLESQAAERRSKDMDLELSGSSICFEEGLRNDPEILVI